ncbi:AMP-binding protein [Pseudonocardia asaccharolytica]|uniref:Long-chain acyl-CoA synthetase n=1 Tax=Pseudonocardia asaccharolytica DSM 44247 = NBRC 16224 TaxID=1123024 RepID=A0A511D5A6_9PSEU|nr:AMP-binding protein [Pseudonocardia asaccharolytica]GEL19986.1 long-chain acyl-CoA synthetase [Pseudonocardia asaccharolytica DSM 44247 = NBRC 16224]
MNGADSASVPRGGGAALTSPTHLADLVGWVAQRTPDHPAVVDVTAELTLTWAELDAAAAAEAVRLRAAGVGPGDRVVVLLGNGAAFCVALFGALRADAVVVPVGPSAAPRELDIIARECMPTVIVADPGGHLAAAAGSGLGARWLPAPDVASGPVSGSGPDSSVSGAPEVVVPSGGQRGGEAVALLVYTSGTTGVPRGVQLSHRALLVNREQTAALRPSPVTPVDRVLLTLPLFHIFGLGAGLLQVCWAGATVVLTERFDPEQVLDTLVRHRVSGVAGVPSMYRALLDLPAGKLREAFAGVRLCTAGGAPLPAGWLAEFRAVTGLEIFEGYGLTETGPVLTSTLVGGTAKPGSVGRPLPGIELRLVDTDGVALAEREPDEQGDVLSDPAEDTGLIAVRGPNLFSGYWPDGWGGPDDEGWFRTPDVGYLDADGDLHLVDRSSDLVIVSGFNVYPREVEQVLAELDAIVEAAVVGIPDERTGEAVKAVVVRAEGSGLSEDEIRTHCAARLARFKVPEVITFVDALPRTPTGKVARRRL